MSKAAIAALDRLMSKERDKELEDHDSETDLPKHVAKIKISGSPKAVDAATHDLGLPTPSELRDVADHSDDMHSADDDREDHAMGGEVGVHHEDEHPAVRALRMEHPEIHADMKRRGIID